MVNEDFTHLGLFEGIGGFSLAARWMGWKTLAWCEWNDFGQKVLRHHFPDAEGFGDITKTDFRKYANTIDILTGGFPCQPYSVAGKRRGKEDERHLWPEMLRAIREIQPRYVVGENVGGLVSWNGGMVFEEVQTDLENEGYEVQAFILPACAKNAPHRRDRVWVVAHSESNGHDAKPSKGYNTERTDNIKSGAERFSTIEGFSNERNVTDPKSGRQRGLRNESETTGTRESDKPSGSVCGICDDADTNGIGLRRQSYGTGESRQFNKTSEANDWENFPTQSPICSGDDGFSDRLDGITFSKWRNESIKAYGNAIVPQVAFEIFKAIEKINSANF
jgi:DNA (cytosine-5)-methyltransferase 1